MRSAASACHVWHDFSTPRGARTTRGPAPAGCAASLEACEATPASAWIDGDDDDDTLAMGGLLGWSIHDTPLQEEVRVC
jgi:hypothetical protein